MMHIPGYQIIRKINQGGMATVYLAVQESVGREVALKVMSPALNADPVFSERFQREANIVGQLSHHHIVAIYDIGCYKNLNYIAMDFLPGGTAHDRILEGISPQEALRITRETALALDYAHEKGYVHRDIKTENILFREDGSAVLSDFGVAKTLTQASRMTSAGTVVGTPHYMSPEQARGKTVDGRADLYSLGVVLFEMLTGSVPYKAEDSVAVAVKHLTAPIPKLPPQFSMYQGITDKLLAKNPDDRFQRGRDLVAAIDRLEITVQRISHTAAATQTDATAVQIYSLFNALVQTLYAVVKQQLFRGWRWLVSWRWSRQRGWYHKLPGENLEAQNNADLAEQATLIATQIQQKLVALDKQPLTYRTLLLAKYGGLLILMVLLTAIFWWQTDLPLKQQVIASLPASVGETLGAKQPQTKQPQEDAAQAGQSPLPGADNKTAAGVPQTVAPAKQQAPVRTFPLTITPSPASAAITIENIKPPYKPGIKLPSGDYTVVVKAPGYYGKSLVVTLRDEAVVLPITLQRRPKHASSFSNSLKNGDKGPEMIVVHGGEFTMGNSSDATTSPVRSVRITKDFAISRYEVTFADFRQFTEATGRKIPSDEGWGQGARPVINVSWQDAKDYTRWLSKVTGKKYRLPSEAEWEYAARAGTSGDYYWDGSASKKANCRMGCDSQYATLFASKPAPVGSYPANPWGLHDTAGNVAEWVEDCYQDHFLAAPRTETPVSVSDCKLRTIRGGAFDSKAIDIQSHSRLGQPAGKRSSNVGFRVAVDLN